LATSPQRISTGAFIAGQLLALICLFFTLIVTAAMSDLTGSDAAGNAMGQGFTAIGLIVLCILLAALVLTAVLGGAMPVSGRVAILLLTPVAYVAIFMAFDLLTRPSVAPGLWALAIPGAAPALIVAYCLWALIAGLRARVPPRVAGFGLLGALALVCASIFPLTAVRDHADAVEAQRVDQWRAKLAATPDDAHLQQWMPFLDSNVYLVAEAARAKILALPSRQGDAEAMLERDEFPFDQLSQFDLDPTPALCQKAQGSLSRRAAALSPPPGQKPDFEKIAVEFDGATSAIKWLVGFACASDPQALAWEALGRSYGASDFEVADLVSARDPKKLGWTLYNSPPKVSMLTPKSSLQAWLNFAYGPGGETADTPGLLAGARALDHRDADALDWLKDDYAADDRFVLLHFLPQLDLDPTPPLCYAALSAIGEDLASVYRPTADNPLPFRELGERLGVGNPLEALKWLAGHGCDADQRLTTALEVVSTYQPSPEREAMAAALTGLKRKP
jgi:hypothetical protein